MARERSDDIENAFEEAWDQAATASDYQHIELLLLADYGRRTLVLNPNDASHSSIRWPERVHLGWLRSGLAGAYQDERLLPRLYESIAKPTGMSLGYHGLGAVSLMPTLMAGGSRRWEQAAVCSVPPRKLAHFRPSSRNHLNVLMRTYPFPTAPEQRRWTSWVSYYMRLWIFVLLVNAVSIVIKIAQDNRYPESFTHGAAATATGANLLVAAIARHEHFINIVFRLACALPLRSPLWLRRRAAKVYSYGGIHSGCGSSALLWYICYATLAVNQFQVHSAGRIALAVTSGLTLMLLTLIIITSHPQIRRCHHNKWEIMHRFGGWTAIALVWTQTLIIVITTAHRESQPVSSVLVATPAFYFLLFITLLLIYPWLRLRRHQITQSELLSNHALRLRFTDRSLPPCKGFRLGTNPILENHGFATIPNSSDEEKGYSILVSNAGDWTGRLIANPPHTIWTRGAPTTGVMRIATLFQPLVIVATGSGIGPCLSFLQPRPDWPVRIIWSCRSPEVTYGMDILRSVMRADREAIIVDTKETGHPDLPALTWAVMEQVAAEAVIVISNPKVTKMVVFELERRGVAAFGAIFDS